MEKLSAVALSSMCAVLALAPTSTFAYLSPEQVFGGAAPPTQREGDAVVEQQQQRSAEQRAAAQAELQPVDAEPEDTYVAEDSSPQLGLFDDNAQYERRQDRIDDNDGNGPTIIIGGDGTVVDADGNVLHSGAPLVTKTGPESVLAMAALLLAGICTFAYSMIRARRLHVA